MKIVIPDEKGVDRELDLFPLDYFGRHVLTTKQLAPIFGCPRQNISTNFNHHIDDFIEGVDYFFLHGIALKIFMNNCISDLEITGKLGKVSGNKLDYRSAFALRAQALYLWTFSGALKHSQYLGTEMAIKILIDALTDYFNAKNPASNSAPQLPPPVQQSLFDDEQPAQPAPEETAPLEPLVQPASNDRQIELLVKFIDLCKNDDLRDELIRLAVNLIFGKRI